MSADIFDYWSGLSSEVCIHPDDEAVLRRVRHDFKLDCLVGPYRGRLRHAPIVLLFLSPGFDEEELEYRYSNKIREYYVRQRTGNCPLPDEEEQPSAQRWGVRIIKQFGFKYDEARNSVAFLNIGAYSSKSLDDMHVLAALPSCRVTLDWAQSVLFPQAERGERVVVCMRSPNYWGLEKGRQYGRSLFAPNCVRGGVMRHDQIRADVIAAVSAACQISN